MDNFTNTLYYRVNDRVSALLPTPKKSLFVDEATNMTLLVPGELVARSKEEYDKFGHKEFIRDKDGNGKVEYSPITESQRMMLEIQQFKCRSPQNAKYSNAENSLSKITSDPMFDASEYLVNSQANRTSSDYTVYHDYPVQNSYTIVLVARLEEAIFDPILVLPEIELTNFKVTNTDYNQEDDILDVDYSIFCTFHNVAVTFGSIELRMDGALIAAMKVFPGFNQGKVFITGETIRPSNVTFEICSLSLTYPCIDFSEQITVDDLDFDKDEAGNDNTDDEINNEPTSEPKGPPLPPWLITVIAFAGVIVLIGVIVVGYKTVKWMRSGPSKDYIELEVQKKFEELERERLIKERLDVMIESKNENLRLLPNTIATKSTVIKDGDF